MLVAEPPLYKGNGNTITEERTTDYVSRVDITGNFKVEINFGDPEIFAIYVDIGAL